MCASSLVVSFEQLPNWVEHLVHILKWTYGALWAITSHSGPAVWKDGWYNLDMSVGVPDHDFPDHSLRIDALFYSTYRACLFAPGFGYVGQVISQRQDAWLTGSEEIYRSAVHTQAIFLKTVFCILCSNNNVLELGTVEQVSKSDTVLRDIQKLLSFVAIPSDRQPTVLGHTRASRPMHIQMAPTRAFSHNYNVDHVSSDMVVNLSQAHNFGPASILSDFDTTPGALKNTNVTLTYLQIQQAAQEENIQRRNQNIQVGQRLSTTSCSQPQMMDDHITTSFPEEWVSPRENFFPVNESADSPIISSGMRLPELSTIDSSMLPIESFSQQSVHVQLGDRNLGFDHDMFSSMARLTPEVGLSGSDMLNMLQNRETCTVYHGSSTVTDSTTTGTNTWEQAGEAKTNIAKDPCLEEVLEGFTGEDQSMQAPHHELQAVVVDHHDISNNWPKGHFATAVPRQCHSPFQYPSGGYLDFEAPSSMFPVRQLQPQALSETVQPQQSSLGLPDEQHWRTSFTTPTKWVPWGRRSSAMRYKPGRSSCSPAVVRRNGQLVLKKLLLNIVPRIAQEQKARDQEETMNIDDGSSDYRAPVRSDYSTPPAIKTESIGQDPQARTHMLAERRRRVRENEHYAALRAIIPPTSRMDKATVLGETIQLVKRLKKRVRHLEKVNPSQGVADDCCNANPSALSTCTSDCSPTTGAAPSQGSERGNDYIGSPPDGAVHAPELPIKEVNLAPEEGMKDECTSYVHLHSIPARADSHVITQSVKEEDDQKEVVEVLTTGAIAESQNQLRVEIRTSNQTSDTIIHILTCFKELSLQVISTHITINNNWIHANFELKMNEDQSHRSSLFSTEVQAALKIATSRAPGEANRQSQLQSDAPS